MQKDIEKLAKKTPAALEKTAKGLTERLLDCVIQLTPVGDYSDTAKGDSKIHKKGGTLRRGWTSKTHEEAASKGNAKAETYVDALPVHTFGGIYVIELLNPVKYAPYVEYGHPTANGKGWVPGVYMLEKSMIQLNKQAPKMIEQNIKELIGGAFSGDG